MDISELPAGAQQIAEAIGLPAFLRLVDAFGGRPLRIHARPKPQSELAMAIGRDAYRNLQREFAGEEVLIPLLSATARSTRNRAILDAYSAGMQAWRIARAHGIHVRTVRAIVASADAEEQKRRQGSLF
jgi:hypothetical protein